MPFAKHLHVLYIFSDLFILNENGSGKESAAVMVIQIL
jgi:hypothetical protein